MDRSNLIVNYLPSGFTETDLDKLFKPFGSLLSVKIVRDKVSGISMGFGFVNFENNASAIAAVATLNGKQLREDKIMKVSVARPAWKANIHSNLYIAGFPTTFTESDLMEYLGVHGTSAENIRLLKDVNKNPRGAAVVRMSSEEAANNVIDALNGIPFDARKAKSSENLGHSTLQVRPWRPEFRPDRISDDNIATSYQKQSTHRYPRKNTNQRPKPVEKSDRFDAAQLLRKLSLSHNRDNASACNPAPTVISNKALPPTSANTPLNEETTNSTSEEEYEREELYVLFIYHLPNDVTDDYLREMFQTYGGDIEAVRVMQGKGYGFVSYLNEKDAVYAMTKLNGSKMEGASRGIEIELRNEVI